MKRVDIVPRAKRAVVALFFTAVMCMQAFAAGPRAVINYSTGLPQMFLQTNLKYYTDAGPLSQYVSHDAADALVLAASSVWNVKGSSLTFTQGGSLDEDVNSANVYFGSTGPIWPSDVQPSNWSAKPVAVVYDNDGSITDMLRGTGASAPSNCRQAATTDTIDGLEARGFSQHAILVINGRCTGPNAEAQLQLKYQLIRAFGRVLGIGWSQTNDNVFTGSPAPTYSQQQHWPIMHPIDIVCGAYTYQCLPDPFTLRADDISALEMVYPNQQGLPLAAGKEYSLTHSLWFTGSVNFPNGMGMTGVNVTIRRSVDYRWMQEDFDIASGVTGYVMRPDYGNPVTGAPATLMGVATASSAGKLSIFGVPVDPAYGWMDMTLTTQSINPLYVGQYSITPYRVAPVAMSGASVSRKFTSMEANFTMPVSSTAGDCSTGADGSETQPAAMPPSGVWTGRFCSAQHTSWFAMNALKGHTMTVEVTAVDETMSSTAIKLCL